MKQLYIQISFLLIILLFNTGCVSISGYQEFYKPYNSSDIEKMKNDPNFEFLRKGSEPDIFTSNDIQKDIRTLRRKRFIPIGYSSFNGNLETEEEVKSQAKKIGAIVAVYSWDYTNTETTSGTLLLPQTNYQNGTIHTNNGGFASYNGTSTGNIAVPFTNTQRRYDQNAVYFIKDIHKLKFGISGIDISREMRIKLGKNGVKVDLIFDNSPVYNSNMLEGDIITKFNDINIDSKQHLHELLTNYDISKKNATFTVYRDGEEKTVTVVF